MKRYQKIIFVLLSFGLPFLLIEFALSWYLTKNLEFSIEMARYNVLSIEPSANPKLAHQHIPLSDHHLMGVDLKINKDGQRDKTYETKKLTSYRMLFLGDSLTLGWGVEEPDTFSSRLENKLTQKYPTEILNFGVANYNTSQEVELLKTKGFKYRPDKVVLFYFINDAEPTPVRSSWAFLGYSRFITLAKSRWQIVRANSAGGPASFKNQYARLYDPQSEGWKGTKQALKELKQLCDEQQVALQVVILPEFHQLQNYPFKKEHTLVSTELEQLSIEYLDLTPYFKDQKDPARLWVARDDAHPNAVGHQLISEYVEDFLSKDLPDRLLTRR